MHVKLCTYVSVCLIGTYDFNKYLQTKGEILTLLNSMTVLPLTYVGLGASPRISEGH